MKKIYLVITSYGSYDDYHTSNERAFHNPIDAEAYKSKIEGEMKRLQDIPNPADDIEDWDLITAEQEKKVDDWEAETYIARDFNSCWVEELRIE